MIETVYNLEGIKDEGIDSYGMSIAKKVVIDRLVYETKDPEFKIRYHRELFPDLPSAVKKGNFIDLYSAEEITLKAGEYGMINLGISVECPKGYWMQVVPRSSTFKNYGVIETNSFGVIDTSYCGDNDIVKMPVYATRDITIPANERVCQFTLVKDVGFNIIEVESLAGNKDRGGFGSTGVK